MSEAEKLLRAFGGPECWLLEKADALAAADEIARLTRERDEARESARYAVASLQGICLNNYGSSSGIESSRRVQECIRRWPWTNPTVRDER